MASLGFRADIRQDWKLWIEWALAAVVLGGLVYTYFIYREIGYLPLPFFPDPSDVYMDGYNTAWWTWNGRPYEDWLTVYPPVSFAILRVISSKKCYESTSGAGRECDWRFWGVMCFLFIMNAVIAYLAFRKIDRRTALPRALAFSLGLPSLYSFEHLNLLLIAWTGFLVAFGPVVRSTRLKWLGIALAVNLKPYFFGLILARLIRRDWRWAEGALLVTVALYLVSYIIIGDGGPIRIYQNIFDFATSEDRAGGIAYIIYSTSYTSVVKFLATPYLPLTTLVGSWILEFWSNIFSGLIVFTQAISLLALILIWYRPESTNRYRVLSIAFLLLLISYDPGGYAMAGCVFLLFCERFRGWALGAAIVCTYVLCFPFDVTVAPLGSGLVNGYLAEHTVRYYRWITVGPFVRPGLLIFIQWMLVVATVNDFRRYQRAERGALAGTSAFA